MSSQAPFKSLTAGDQAPDFELPATDGQSYSLSSFRDQPLFCLVFWANHCPYVGSWEDRMVAIAGEFGPRGVGFAVVSSNDASRFPQDSPEEMARRAQEQHYSFPYLYDEDQSVARAYGATRTPEVYLFDRERNLRYHGAIDSDYEERPGTQHYLRETLDRLLSGRPVDMPETRPVGCSLKLSAV
jgi:peroxiredoxin